MALAQACSPTFSRSALNSSSTSRSTSCGVTVSPESSVTPLNVHCQTCEREISAVAASSMRLLIAAAPLPPSHASRYWMPMLMLSRRPCSVRSPGVCETESRSSAVTATSPR